MKNFNLRGSRKSRNIRFKCLPELIDLLQKNQLEGGIYPPSHQILFSIVCIIRRGLLVHQIFLLHLKLELKKLIKLTLITFKWQGVHLAKTTWIHFKTGFLRSPQSRNLHKGNPLKIYMKMKLIWQNNFSLKRCLLTPLYLKKSI